MAWTSLEGTELLVRTIAESVDAERAWILARAHAHPGRNGNGRDDTLQPSVDAKIHQATQVYQSLIAEDDFGCGAIQSQYADFHVIKFMLSE